MNKREEMIYKINQAEKDGEYRTYKTKDEIGDLNDKNLQDLYINMQNYLSDKRTHVNY